jgi:hypothetical protein
MADRTEPYKALTRLHLPVIEKDYNPGDEVPISDLEEAGQDVNAISDLITGGALGEAGDELHPSTIIPSPDMPTIQSVVAQAQEAVAELKERGEEVPPELQAVADLDFHAVDAGDEGKSGDASAG